MRTTITIDDDMLAAAKALAQANSISIGRAISDLARRGLRATPRIDSEYSDTEFPMFKVSHLSPPITLDDIKRLEDEV